MIDKEKLIEATNRGTKLHDDIEGYFDSIWYNPYFIGGRRQGKTDQFRKYYKYETKNKINFLSLLNLKIERVMFNDPATIVFWSDGTKTVAKCSDEDYYDKTTGLAIAVCKKIMGRDYREIFQEFIPEEDIEEMNNIPYGWPTFFDNVGPFGVTSEEAAKKMNKPLGVTLEEATKNMNQHSKIIIEGSIEIK